MPTEVRRHPGAGPFGGELAALVRLAMAHPGGGWGEPPLQGRVEIGPGSEHAVIVGRRRPDLSQRAFGHQALAAHRPPERAADCAGIGATVEHRANDLGLARAGVTMLADVAVEAQSAIVLSLD